MPSQEGFGARSAFLCLLSRDLRLGRLRPAEGITPVGFCLVATTLFAFGAGPEQGELRGIAPGVIWTTALLSMVISVETMFSADYEDGTLEQMLLSPNMLSVLVAARVVARWIWSAFPIVLLSPLLGVMLGLESHALPELALTLLLGTPTLYLFGAFGSALLVGQRRGSALLALLALPLCVPVLIFAAGAVSLAQEGLDWSAPASMLGGLLALAATFMPPAIAAVLAGNGSGG